MSDNPPADPSTDYLMPPLLLRLAREIAIGGRPLEKILERFEITQEHWADIEKNPQFQQFLKQSIEEWQSAENTKERVAVKAGVMIEDWLAEAHRRLHDKSENLTGVTALATAVGKLAGISGTARDGGGDGDKAQKFSVVINIGDGKTLKVEKDVTPKVIDAKPESA